MGVDNEVLARIQANSKKGEELVVYLQKELAVIKQAALSKYEEMAVNQLKKEHEQLQNEVEFWKTKVIKLEILNGIQQYSLPSGDAKGDCSKGMSNPTKENIDETPPNQMEAKNAIKQHSGEKKEAKKDKPAKAPKKEILPKEENKEVDVSRLDLRIGRILFVEKHPDAESLYVEQIDIGEEKPRTVVSGLVKFIPIEEMQNRLVVVLCNLKPAKMRGVTSEAMVMCASTPEKVEILCPPQNCVPGDRVTCENYPGEPDALLPPKKKIFEQVAPDLKTNSEFLATYKLSPLVVLNKGPLKANTLAGVQIK